MKVNHESTKTVLLQIIDELRAQADRATKYNAESHEITENQQISITYKQNLIDDMRVKYLASLEESRSAMRALIERLLAYESDQDKIIEYDVPEYANTIATIKATKGQLPADVIKLIKYNFAGQYNNLVSIATLFKMYGIDVLEYGYKEYVRDAVDALTEIDIMIENMETSAESVHIDLRNIMRKVVTFGEVRGLTFADEEKSLGAFNDEIAEDLLVDKVMGLFKAHDLENADIVE